MMCFPSLERPLPERAARGQALLTLASRERERAREKEERGSAWLGKRRGTCDGWGEVRGVFERVERDEEKVSS
jgi:hypothetical protein